jgi:PIN domain nuclease of toxin-antitoxin system
MEFLIDTQILIWYQLDSGKLSKNSIDILLNLSNQIYVSQVTLFELAIKQKIGKLPELDISIGQLLSLINRDGFKILQIQDKHIAAYSEIPLLSNHRDPFDRLIIATAFHERMPLISADEKFKAYKDIINLLENN